MVVSSQLWRRQCKYFSLQLLLGLPSVEDDQKRTKGEKVFPVKKIFSSNPIYLQDHSGVSRQTHEQARNGAKPNYRIAMRPKESARL